jgi:ribonuclease P protein component
MLRKINRITKNKEFDFIFLNGQSVHTRLFWLKHHPSQTNVFRLGVMISSKTEKSAVKRNLMKRRVRAVIKDELPKLLKPTDLVLVLKKEALIADKEEFQRTLVTSLKRAGLYK